MLPSMPNSKAAEDWTENGDPHFDEGNEDHNDIQYLFHGLHVETNIFFYNLKRYILSLICGRSRCSWFVYLFQSEDSFWHSRNTWKVLNPNVIPLNEKLETTPSNI